MTMQFKRTPEQRHNIDRLLDVLEGGNQKRAVRKLRLTDGSMCCLGVAANLVLDDINGKWDTWEENQSTCNLTPKDADTPLFRDPHQPALSMTMVVGTTPIEVNDLYGFTVHDMGVLTAANDALPDTNTYPTWTGTAVPAILRYLRDQQVEVITVEAPRKSKRQVDIHPTC